MLALFARRSTVITLLATTAALACTGEGAEMAADATPTTSDVADSSPAPTGPLDVCDLVERAEVEAALGQTVTDPTTTVIAEASENTAAIAQCDYRTESSGATATVFARRSPANDNTVTAIDSVRSGLEESGLVPEDVGGVGDRAFRAGNQLHVYVGGNRYLIVTVTGTADDAAAARTIAAHAAGRI